MVVNVLQVAPGLVRFPYLQPTSTECFHLLMGSQALLSEGLVGVTSRTGNSFD